MGIYLKIARSFEKNKLLKYALITNTCFGVVLRGIGDLIQQTIEMKATTKKPKEIGIFVPNEREVNQEHSMLKSNTFQTQKYDWTRTRTSFFHLGGLRQSRTHR